MKVVGQQKVKKNNMDYEKKGLTTYLDEAPRVGTVSELVQLTEEECIDTKSWWEVEAINKYFEQIMQDFRDAGTRMSEEDKRWWKAYKKGK